MRLKTIIHLTFQNGHFLIHFCSCLASVTPKEFSELQWISTDLCLYKWWLYLLPGFFDLRDHGGLSMLLRDGWCASVSSVSHRWRI